MKRESLTNNERYKPYILTEEQQEILNNISNNPGLVIEHAYSILKRATDGLIDIPNPTNPFSYLLECSATQATTLHASHDVTYRNQYPRLASQYSHLYNHMFDEHYIGRFATPGRAKFELFFKKSEILFRLENTETNGLKRIIIPRGSVITTQDYIFTLLYSIEISQSAHGGCNILYLTDEFDPVQPLASNIVEWSYVEMNGEEYFRIRPTLYNVKLTQITDTILTDGYSKKFQLTDRFVHCRVYKKENNKLTEINTTHSDLVYDPTRVTAKLIYLEENNLTRSLTVEIPSLYHNTKMLGTQIVIEIYTSPGQVEEPINEYSADSFTYQWSKLENLKDDYRFVAPLENISNPIVLSSTILHGGKNGESFKETRDRVINFAGYVDTPITPNQLDTALKIGQYDVLKSRDTITSRSYLATRALPLNKHDTFEAGAASSMETIKTSIRAIESHPDVRNNGRRITITPNMLFKTNNAGIVSIVNPLDNPKYNRGKYNTEEYIGEINKLQYMYTPFYYVMDPTGDTFSLRAYYMDNPGVENQMFIGNNYTSGYSVSSDDIAIIRYKNHGKTRKNGMPDEGFKIRVRTTTSEDYRKIPPEKLFCQLAVIPKGDKNFASISGELLGYVENEETELKEYIWEFTIPTSWDVTDKDGLIVHDFYMHLNEPRKFEIDLKGDFYFVYGAKDVIVKDYQPDKIDKLINREIITDTHEIIAISADRVQYRLGWRLNNFWCNGIPVQGEVKYETVTEDIPMVYRNDVYEVDSDGIYVIENDNLKILHRAGDKVLDKQGNPIYLARRGDVKLDNQGKPIKIKDRELEYLIDIMMVDGVYYFADDDEDVKYRDSIGNTVKDYIVEDLTNIHDRLLENTLLYFYPKRTMGEAILIVDNGNEIQEPMRMSFNVTYYMDEARYGNLDIREAIKQKTGEIISEQLKDVTVTTSNIISALRAMGGEDIVSVHLDKFGYLENRKFTTYTSRDPSVRCSVKRLVRVQADNSIKVVEDINVNFVKHENIEELKYHY